jgi:hypothetical protein
MNLKYKYIKLKMSDSINIDINTINRLTGGDAFYPRILDTDFIRQLTGPVKPQPRQPSRNISHIFKYHKSKL